MSTPMGEGLPCHKLQARLEVLLNAAYDCEHSSCSAGTLDTFFVPDVLSSVSKSSCRVEAHM